MTPSVFFVSVCWYGVHVVLRGHTGTSGVWDLCIIEKIVSYPDSLLHACVQSSGTEERRVNFGSPRNAVSGSFGLCVACLCWRENVKRGDVRSPGLERDHCGGVGFLWYGISAF